MKKAGRKPFRRPDGAPTQKPSQTFAANAVPRTGTRKRSVYNEMRMQQKRKHTFERPGYGRTGGY